MSIVSKEKRKVINISMEYNQESYKRTENHYFDYEQNCWVMESIYWTDPKGFRIATLYEGFPMTSAHFDKKIKENNEILFNVLEREYKLNSLDI